MPKTIADFRAEYAKADALCQEVQLFRNKASFPAIIELRNAGHHFLRALNDDGSLRDVDELNNAIGHCRRACYEATEAGIMFALAVVKKFKDDYSAITVSGIITDYVRRLRRCSEALRLIDAGRQEGFDRTQDHNDRTTVFRELRTFSDDLDAAREEANKKVAEDRRLTRRFIIQIAVALLSISVVASFGIWASTGYEKFWALEEAEPSAQQ